MSHARALIAAAAAVGLIGAVASSLAAPKLPISKVTLGDVGLEPSSLDRSADPCVDFFQFACGGWLQNNPIPVDRARWGRLDEADDRNKLVIKQLLDSAARSNGDGPTKKLGEYYASCLDEVAIDRAGTSAFRTLLARTEGVVDAASWLTAVIELHKLGVFVVWDHQVRPDLRASSTYATYLDAGGLSLPDRNYYDNPRLRDKLDGLDHHARRMFELLSPPGVRGAPLDAGDVVAIEIELAQLTRSAAERRDLAASASPIDVAGLGKQARSVDWAAYLRGVGADRPGAKILLGAPAFFAGLDKLRAKFKPAQWASYFTFHLLEHFAYALPKPFDDEAFELHKLVTGAVRQGERGRRCIELTSHALGDVIAADYAARVGEPVVRGATQLVDAVTRAMHDELAGLDWMSDATRQRALAKLGKTAALIGAPARWRSYDFAVRRDDFAGNALRAAAFDTRRRLARTGRAVDRGEWALAAYDVDAGYDLSRNTIELPAGLLQHPWFADGRTVPANLGGLGLAVGHELSHGFDDQGAQLDADGNLARWWQDDDLARFSARGQCVADQYATFEALPHKYLTSSLTLGEAIADLAGVKLAFLAYRALRKDAVKTYVADGFSEDQQFFLAVGQAWCGRERAAETERMLTSSPQPPAKLRIYGALRNLPEFADAFRCAAGTPMRPAKPCSVW